MDSSDERKRGYCFPSDFEERVGFSPVREAVARLALSSMGQRGVLESGFETDRVKISLELNRLHELKSLLLMQSGFPAEGYIDFTAELVLLRLPEKRFTEHQLHQLRLALRTVAAIVSYLGEHGEAQYLREMAAPVVLPLEPLQAVERLLEPSGALRDDASPELHAIRRALASRVGKIAQRMQLLLLKAQRDGLLDSDAQVMVRDGRPVLPIPAGSRKHFSAVVQGRSASGQTLFVEPLEVLEMEQEIRELEMREQEEVARILQLATDAFRPYMVELKGCFSFLGAVDTLRAKALYAIQVGGARPIIAEESRLYLRQAYHPLLFAKLRKEGRKTVPLDVELTHEHRILVISGPNAGGKSVCLKTIAVAVYMMQCGFLPFVLENSEMGIFSAIFLDIGDAQSMESDLSTYSSHLVAMRHFTSRASASTLCLLDELGAGTEPVAGGAMAQAVLEELVRSGTLGVVTTHYGNLKNLASNLSGLRSGAMRYDMQRLMPLYELELDMPGSSFAFEIAKKLSLPPTLIARAEAIAGQEYVSLEEQLRAVARDRAYWGKKREEIKRMEREMEALRRQLEEATQELQGKRREILNAARSEAKALLAESNRRIEHTIREIRESEASKEQTKRVREELREFQKALERQIEADREKVVQPEKPAKGALSPGMPVRIVGSDSVGQVVSVDGKRVVVALGQMLTSMEREKLEVLSQAEYRREQRAERGPRIDSLRQRRLDFHPDLDVRGMRSVDAVQAVERLVDDALMVGASQVRVLHGKGDGILRQQIREALKQLPSVLHYGDEAETFGGAGITVVEMEKS